MKKRCQWCEKTELEKAYHDKEWGKPLYDDDQLFEFLCLEGAQAGLSWLTILKKRDAYRQAFDHFDAHKVSLYDEQKVDSLMQDASIIRNRLKIKAFITNAKAFLAIQKSYGSFHRYLWSFVPEGRPIVNHYTKWEDIPASNALSHQLSQELKKQGFKFVGPTICYAFMQAIGMVNDHTTDCFRYQELIQETKL